MTGLLRGLWRAVADFFVPPSPPPWMGPPRRIDREGRRGYPTQQYRWVRRHPAAGERRVHSREERTWDG